MNWRNLTPRQRQLAVAAAGAAVLALIAILGRRRAGGGEDDVALTGSRSPSSTFADNGEAASALWQGVTDALASVGPALDNVSVGQDAIIEALNSRAFDEPRASEPVVINIGGEPVEQATDTAAAVAAVTTSRAAAPGAVRVAQGGPRAGKRYIQRTNSRGQVVNDYLDRNVKDVVVKKAAPRKPAAKPKPEPKPKPKPKPKAKAPAKRKAAPARRPTQKTTRTPPRKPQAAKKRTKR